jgi:hypothetical protein
MRVADEFEFGPAPQWACNAWDEFRAAMALPEWRHVPPPPLPALPVSPRRETPRRQRKPRKPSVAALVKRAERTGKRVTSITTPDGTTIYFGNAEPSEANAPRDASVVVPDRIIELRKRRP